MDLFHPVKIGSLQLNGNLFLAPVAGYSDRSFRSICIENGASFTYTEMVSAEALVRNNEKTELLMKRAENEKSYAVQIFGGNEQTMAEAAKIVYQKTHCECIDINAGCPVPKIVKTGAGSSLTKNPEQLGKIVGAVKNAVGTKTQVTVKIRSGWDSSSFTYLQAAQKALENGADAITLHPRTKAQGYEGKSDWQKLKELVKFVNGKVPVFGSGDLFSPEDAKNMIEQTGVSGIMFARGAMGNPFIFTKTIQLLKTGEYQEIPYQKRIQTGFLELNRLCQDLEEGAACREMRKRFCAYSKGIQGGAELRQKIIHASSVQDYIEIFKQNFTL